MGGGKLGEFGSDIMDGYTVTAIQYNNASGTSNYDGPTTYR